MAQQPTVLFKRTRHHKGSIYCMSWTPDGTLIATGSNDKTVKLMKFNVDTSNLEGQEIELAMHDGTVRDVCFLEDTTNRSSLLISGGAGDCKIYVTDCETGQPYQALSGHSGKISARISDKLKANLTTEIPFAGHVLSLYNWGGAMFVSGSHDRSIRFWDLRTRGCVNVVTPNTSLTSRVSIYNYFFYRYVSEIGQRYFYTHGCGNKLYLICGLKSLTFVSNIFKGCSII